MVVERIPFPSPVTGYPLAQGAGSGLFSFVLTDRSSQVVNLNDIGCYVVAYRGGGLPQVRNLYNQVATTGKTQTIKTLVSEQTLELTIAVMVDKTIGEDTLTALQRVTTTLALYLAPSESRQTSANFYIRYQSRGDDCLTRGVAIQRLYKYVGGLDDYVIDNREQLRLSLRFESFEGSKWQELTDTTVNFNTDSSITEYLLTLNLSTGAVAAATGTIGTIDLPQRVFKDEAGTLWVGGAVNAGTSSIKGTVNYAGAEAGGGYVGSFAERIPGAGNPNVLYAAKVSPDTSTSYLLKLAVGDVAWSAVAGANNSIYDMAATENGYEILVAGNFTTPDTRLAKIDGSGTFTSIGSATDANAAVYSVSNISGSRFVVAGAFTLLGATTVGRIGIIDMAAATLVSTLAGGLSETIYAVKALPTGEVYALGQLKIYYWNGSKWSSTNIVGQNTTATNTTSALNNYIGYDKNTGALYFCGRGVGTFGAENHHVRQIIRGVMGAPVGISNSDSTGLSIKKTAVVYDGIMYISSSAGSGVKPAPTTITYTGTNDQQSLHFTFTTTVSGNLLYNTSNKCSVFMQVKNWATGKVIMIDMPQGVLRYSQNLVIDINQDGRPIAFYVANASGNIQTDLTRYILPGSDTDSFALVRGTNYIEIWGRAGGNAFFDTAVLTYQNAHYGADGSVNQTIITVS